MHRVVQYSGGLGSWAAAKRTVAFHGTENLTLLFCDTLIEDDDLYRFLAQSAANVFNRRMVLPEMNFPGLEEMEARKEALERFRNAVVRQLPGLVWLKDGRQPWEVFADKRFIGNTRADPCSKVLKRDLALDWVHANGTAETLIRVIGIDWTEEHRFIRVQTRSAPWVVEAPLCGPPYLSKRDILQQCEACGLVPPRLYSMGFPHNNCGGFCVKAGFAQFKNLLLKMPERYDWHEQSENKAREVLGNVTILRDRRNKTVKPLSLTAFRERIQAGEAIDEHDFGGCGCALED